MTARQFDRKYRTLRRQLLGYLDLEVDRLVKSGGIDMYQYGNDFEAPKIVLCAALKNAVFTVQPNTVEGKNTVKNLDKF